MFEGINNMHSIIKLIMSHTTRDDEPLEGRCDCDAMTSIPFLDTSCSIIEGHIVTDLFKNKPAAQAADADLSPLKLHQ